MPPGRQRRSSERRLRADPLQYAPPTTSSSLAIPTATPGIRSRYARMNFCTLREFFQGGKYVRPDNEPRTAAPLDHPQMGSSFAQGIKRCIVPLRADADGPGEYTIRLHFPSSAASGTSKPAFDIKLQGTVVAKAFDPAQASRNTPLEFSGVRVDRNLELEFIPADKATAPVLSGLEVLCTSPTAGTKTGQVAQQ